MKIKKIINYIEVISNCFIFTAVILVIIAFYTAYFNPSKSVFIFINKYGEANFEAFVLFPLILISGIYNFVKNCF